MHGSNNSRVERKNQNGKSTNVCFNSIALGRNVLLKFYRVLHMRSNLILANRKKASSLAYTTSAK